MGIQIDALKCTGCMACEMACGYHRDDGFALLSSCIVAYRTKEKKDYFGVILKREEDLFDRPTGRDGNQTHRGNRRSIRFRQKSGCLRQTDAAAAAGSLRSV